MRVCLNVIMKQRANCWFMYPHSELGVCVFAPLVDGLVLLDGHVV